MGKRLSAAAPEKNPGPRARQSAVRGDLFYISMCSGGAIIKISAAERPNFVLGQLIIVGAMFVVTLAELTLWRYHHSRRMFRARPRMGDIGKASAVINSYFAPFNHKPTSTNVAVLELGEPEQLIEIQMVAVVD